MGHYVIVERCGQATRNRFIFAGIVAGNDVEVGFKEDANYLVFDVFDSRLHAVSFQSLSLSEVDMTKSAEYIDSIIRAILTYRDISFSKSKVRMRSA